MHKNRKIPALIAVIVLALGVLGGGALWVNNYVQSRYSTSEYYAQVPADYAPTLVDMKDMNGAVVGRGYPFELIAYDADGNSHVVEFTVPEPGSDISRGTMPPKAGDYVKVFASKTLVNDWRVIAQSDVPSSVMPLLTK